MRDHDNDYQLRKEQENDAAQEHWRKAVTELNAEVLEPLRSITPAIAQAMVAGMALRATRSWASREALDEAREDLAIVVKLADALPAIRAYLAAAPVEPAVEGSLLDQAVAFAEMWGTEQNWPHVRDAYVAAILRERAIPPAVAPAAVKQLEWNLTCTLKDGQTVWCAEAPGLNMTYSIWSSPDGNAVSPFGSSNIHNGFFETLDEGKAAAQSDYETRIRTALTPPAAPNALDVVSRADVLRICKELGKIELDYILEGLPENARTREAAEAMSVRIRTAVAIMPSSTPPAAPTAIDVTALAKSIHSMIVEWYANSSSHIGEATIERRIKRFTTRETA